MLQNKGHDAQCSPEPHKITNKLFCCNRSNRKQTKMADNVAFRALLENRMNLTAATTDAIEDQGITTLPELAELDYDDIKGLVTNILKFIAPNAAGGNVRIPYVAQKKLYAAKYWFETQIKYGLPAPCGGLTNAELTLALARRKEVEKRKAATKDQEL